VIQRLNLGLVPIIQNVNTLKVKINRSQKGLNALNVVKVYLSHVKAKKTVKNGSLKAVLTIQNVIIKNGDLARKVNNIFTSKYYLYAFLCFKI